MDYFKEVTTLRDVPLDIWEGGEAGVFTAYKLFFHLRKKTILFLAINVRRFLFYVSSKKFFVVDYAFPIMYVIICCFFWSTYLSSISTTNFFFCPHFQQTFFSDFCGDKLFFSIFFRLSPRYQMVRPLTVNDMVNI